MFPNLDAEQARNGHSNTFVANQLGISRQSLEKKKKNGGFKLAEINILLSMYDSNLEYLFSSQKMTAPAALIPAQAV